MSEEINNKVGLLIEKLRPVLAEKDKYWGKPAVAAYRAKGLRNIVELLAGIKSEEEYVSFLKTYLSGVQKEYSDADMNRTDIPVPRMELMKWMYDQIPTPPEETPDVECKDPVEGLDLRFDQVAGQRDVKTELEKNYIYPFTFPLLFTSKSKGILLYGPPGTGKCLAPDEKVIMFDGTVKEAQNIVDGDLLMGDDSTSRKVMSTCTGTDEMYRIVPDRGEPFVVNEPHILTLVSTWQPVVNACIKKNGYKVMWMDHGNQKTKTFTGINDAEKFCEELGRVEDVVDIPLNEYLTKSKTWKDMYKGYRVGVEWDESPLPLDPYLLGLWLGDGCSYHTQVTNVDKEILDELDFEFRKTGINPVFLEKDPITCNISKDAARTNEFALALKELNLFQNKHIPHEYIKNSRKNRLELLAGLVDSDDYLDNNCYEIIQKSKNLSNDITFLARSLGFYVSIKQREKTCTTTPGGPKTGVYHCMQICGEGIDLIPSRILKEAAPPRTQNKNASRFGFTVESLGPGRYCGFTLNQNSRFLLKDFTVTHNTMLAKAATAELAGAAFFAPTPGELRGKYEGDTEKNIANVFRCAQETVDDEGNDYKFAIIFMDEFDSIASSRSDDQSMRRSVNALLQAMDGMKEMKNVSVIAATNYPWDIDDAVLRRFSARIFIDLPDMEAREWLVRSSLAENYAIPTMPKKQRTLNLITARDPDDGSVTEWNDTSLELISRHGSEGYCKGKKQVKGRWYGSRSTDADNIINSDFLVKVEGRLGPNKAAKEVIEKIKGGTFVETDTIDEEYEFGYSASDISKMMTVAIQKASFRALEGGFASQKIGGSGTYFIAYPLGNPSVKYVANKGVLESLGNEEAVKYKVMTAEQGAQAVNFSICQDDIYEAMDEYRSTIKPKIYVELLNYKYLNKTPS